MARISLKQWKEDNDYTSDDLLQVMEEAMNDGVCPALCDAGCEVEPDGHCKHGAPSLMLAMGMI